MKWGVRRPVGADGTVGGSGRKPTSKEIKAARERHNARADKIGDNVNIGRATYDRDLQKKAAANIRKLANEPGAADDASIAGKLTRGERAASYLVFGVFAPLINSSAQRNRTELATRFMSEASKVSIKDFDKERSNA